MAVKTFSAETGRADREENVSHRSLQGALTAQQRPDRHPSGGSSPGQRTLEPPGSSAGLTPHSGLRVGQSPAHSAPTGRLGGSTRRCQGQASTLVWAAHVCVPAGSVPKSEITASWGSVSAAQQTPVLPAAEPAAPGSQRLRRWPMLTTSRAPEPTLPEGP